LILLADEPTGNLDPATSVGIMRILDRINRTGTTVVMATHDHAIVDAMRRRVVEIDRGRIIRDESRGIYETGPAPTVPETTEIQTVIEEDLALDEDLALGEPDVADGLSDDTDDVETPDPDAMPVPAAEDGDER
jgi:energy-coupling factor transporter ATP-binding protein EcfA2